MKPTKRQSDPLGRSTTRHRYSRYLLSLAIAITGSVWPIQARSIEPIFHTPGSTFGAACAKPPKLPTRAHLPMGLTAALRPGRQNGAAGLRELTNDQ
jgi:hypothetical protein